MNRGHDGIAAHFVVQKISRDGRHIKCKLEDGREFWVNPLDEYYEIY